MYLRSTPRRNKDGSEVRYLQLAHNVWDPQKRRSTVQVVYNFGREDAANREALQRLAASVTRFLDPDAALAAPADGLAFTESRPLGGTWALDALWAQLGIGKEMSRLLKDSRRDASAERVLFALVANRALAPSSKLAASRWVSEDVLVTGLATTTDDACYRAMDWLAEIRGDLEKKVFDSLVTLLNLEGVRIFNSDIRDADPSIIDLRDDDRNGRIARREEDLRRRHAERQCSPLRFLSSTGRQGRRCISAACGSACI